LASEFAAVDALVTSHARVRMQQRGISAEALEALLEFGCERHIHVDGREIVFFDKQARRRAGKAAVCTYAIVGSDGTVITVGHRYKRVRRD
jgi:hypothetical protein